MLGRPSLLFSFSYARTLFRSHALPMPDRFRALLPHTEHLVYLNHAATGVLSKPVRAAVDAYLEERHRTEPENYERVQPIVEEARERVGRLVGAPKERVAFAANTSSALNVLAEGFPWQPGDRIALPACEFPANVYPFLHQQRKGVEVDFIAHREGTFTPEDVERALTPQTRLVTLSWVQFLSGFCADLEAIAALCRERGILLCVDAIQGLGALQLDAPALGIDFVAGGSHKWLMGTQGLGFLYVSEDLQERLTPRAGWLHGPVDWENFFDYELAFHEDAARYHLGTMNHVGIITLHAALGVYEDLGPAWVEERVVHNARDLAAGLANLGFARWGTDDPARGSGIVTVAHPEASALYEHLHGQGIRLAMRNGLLRFSPHAYNTEAELDAALEAIATHGRDVS